MVELVYMGVSFGGEGVGTLGSLGGSMVSTLGSVAAWLGSGVNPGGTGTVEGIIGGDVVGIFGGVVICWKMVAS